MYIYIYMYIYAYQYVREKRDGGSDSGSKLRLEDLGEPYHLRGTPAWKLKAQRNVLTRQPAGPSER